MAEGRTRGTLGLADDGLSVKRGFRRLAISESFFQFALMALENRQGVFKLLQRLFGAVRAASKISQPFDPLPLTHNHHASAKHAFYGGFQQQVSHRVSHRAKTLSRFCPMRRRLAAPLYSVENSADGH
jgi:hypothetical protein